jgi:hypothetical protein
VTDISIDQGASRQDAISAMSFRKLFGREFFGEVSLKSRLFLVSWRR